VESDILSDFGTSVGSLLHHIPELGIPVESAQFLIKLLLKQNSCCAPRFPLSVTAVATNFLAAKLHSLYGKESQSEILERSVLESDISPPTPQPWIPYLNDGLY